MLIHPRRGHIGMGVAFAISLVLSPALAAPAVSINTKFAEISVTIDDALKAHPGLAADLTAEGKKWAAKARAETEKEKKENPESFQEGRKWTYERNYSFRSFAGNRYVSVLRADGTYQGGAHPNQNIDTILWDTQAKKRVSIRPFFKETADNGPTLTALAKLVQLAVVTEKAVRAASQDDDKKEGKKEPTPSPEDLLKDDSQVTDAIKPTLLKLGPVTLAPSSAPGKSSGLTFHFSPYDVDAYAAGPYTVFVAWEKLKPYLSTEGAAIFGGGRPANDTEQQ
jgi:hypothetical protein